jgi:hypothetical protein
MNAFFEDILAEEVHPLAQEDDNILCSIAIARYCNKLREGKIVLLFLDWSWQKNLGNPSLSTLRVSHSDCETSWMLAQLIGEIT